MSPKQFARIREKHLELSQTELAELLGLSGKGPISHYENGFRNPSPLIKAVMSYFDSLSKNDAKAFMKILKRHMDAVQDDERRRRRE